MSEIRGDRDRAAAAVRELLSALGLDPDAESLHGTPERVADTYAEFFAGVGEDPAELLRRSPEVETPHREVVTVRNIGFRSVCEHHLLPFHGTVHLAYLPGEKVIGLGTLPRLVALTAARPQVQERLGDQIADALIRGLGARGSLVVIEARHGCVSDRNLSQPEARAITVASRGALAEPAQRSDVLTLLTVEEAAS